MSYRTVVCKWLPAYWYSYCLAICIDTEVFYIFIPEYALMDSEYTFIYKQTTYDRYRKRGYYEGAIFQKLIFTETFLVQARK